MTRLLLALGMALSVASQIPTGAAVVSGVVVDDRGAPLAGASLTLTCTQPPMTRSTIADAAGRFTISSLPSGTFTLTGAAAGYASREFGQARPDAAGTPIQLSDAQRMDAGLTLPRVGSISGVLRDERGQPGTGSVSAVTYIRLNGVRTRRSVGSVEVDADGGYRLASLVPGDYVVSASGPYVGGDARRMTPELIALATRAVQRPDQPVPPVVAGSAPTFRYRSSYYQNATSEATATTITLGPGEDRLGIDLDLQVSETTQIDGIVLDPFDKPIAYALVDVIDPKEQRSVARSSSSSAAGEFRVSGVAPGAYVLMTHHTIRLSGPGEPDVLLPLWGLADVNASAGWNLPVTLRLVAGMTVSGRMVFDGASPAPTDFRNARVELVSVSGPFHAIATPGAMLTRIDPRGGFSIAASPPGTFVLRAGLDAASPWALRSATVGGREIIDASFDVRQGTDVGDVVLTFTDRGTEVSGVLADATGRAVAGTVAVFSADPRWWTTGSRRVQLARADANGRFMVRGLPPGEYLVASGDAAALNLNRQPEPAVLTALAPTAVRFELAEAEKKAIAIRLR